MFKICFSTGSCRYVYLSKSFLFSLYNINGYAPVKVFTHVLIGDYPLVEETTCAYPTTLQATAIPTPTVTTPTPSPLGTLHMVGPVDFMRVDPVSISLPLTLRCFTRQQLKPCKGRSCLPIQAV